MAFSGLNTAQQSEINVTPLIDVLLVLLIIFMVIVPVMPRGLESRIPDQVKAAESTQAPVSLRVLGDDGRATGSAVRYQVDGRMVDRSGLRAALSGRLNLNAQRACMSARLPR